MSFRITETSILDDVGRRLSEALTGRSVKEVQAFAGHVSHPTAIKFRRGELPSVAAPFFAVLKRLGNETAAWVLEPLIGSRNQIDLAARLDELDRNLGALRHDLSRSSPAVVAGPAHSLGGDAGRGLGGPRGGGAYRGAEGVAPLAGALRSCEEASGGVAEEGCVSVRRADLAGGRSAPLGRHLTDHLQRWRESSGGADRSGLIAEAQRTPRLRTSIVAARGDDLLFEHISPAFRLHANERENLVGRSVTACFDKEYAEACAGNTRAVLASREPALDEVRATVKVEPGVTMSLKYRRLVLPYRGFAVCASEVMA